MKTKRVVVKMSDEEYGKLEGLAAANTSSNNAQLIRSLVNRAYMLPSEFGLLPAPAQPAPVSTADAMREARAAQGADR